MAYDGLLNYSIVKELDGKIINGKIDKIHIKIGLKIKFERMDDIYFLENNGLAIVFEDKEGKKQILKELGNKWILEDYREEK